MNPASITIKSIIDATPGYTFEQLAEDLGKSGKVGRLLDCQQVQVMLSVKRSTVENLVKDGTLPKVLLKGTIPRYRESDVAKLIEGTV